MNCPVCKEPIIVLEHNKVEIDHCLNCGGIWLDARELELLLGDAEKRDRLLSSFEIDKHTKEEKRRCPMCLKKMEKILCGTDKKIRIDKCRKNHGLWFDKGELEEVVRSGYLGENNKVSGLLNEIFGSA